jgi:hypothetical protein
MLKPLESKALSNQEFKSIVVDLENKLLASDNPLVVKGNSETFPLTHSFSEGVYIREMSMRQGGLVIGKIHNKSHTWFLMKGSIIVANENGVEKYTAPTYVNAISGAKRVIQALEDSVFINVHPNPDNITDITELENLLTCDSYEEYKEFKDKNTKI